MAKYKIEDIKKDVRKILAENENISDMLDDASIDDNIVFERDEIIENLVCKAIDRVHLYAPHNLLSGASVSATTTENWIDSDDYCKMLNLPDDFLRLVFVRLSSWRVPVYTTTEVETDEYNQARSPFNIMRPSPRHPMVAIVSTDNGLTLEAYPKPNISNGGTNNCYIVTKAEVDGNNEVIIADNCYNAVIYTIANLYYVSINENDKAKSTAEEVADILGKDNN